MILPQNDPGTAPGRLAPAIAGHRGSAELPQWRAIQPPLVQRDGQQPASVPASQPYPRGSRSCHDVLQQTGLPDARMLCKQAMLCTIMVHDQCKPDRKRAVYVVHTCDLPGVTPYLPGLFHACDGGHAIGIDMRHTSCITIPGNTGHDNGTLRPLQTHRPVTYRMGTGHRADSGRTTQHMDEVAGVHTPLHRSDMA